MQAGLYHPLSCERSGVQSLRMLEPAEDVLVRIPSVSAIVHVAPDPKNILDSFAAKMLPCLEQFRQFDELREVTFFLCRQEMKSAKKRNHVVQNRLEIVHLVVPDA